MWMIHSSVQRRKTTSTGWETRPCETILIDFFFNIDLEDLRYGAGWLPGFQSQREMQEYGHRSYVIVVSLTGGFQDNNSTLTINHLMETPSATQLNLTKPRWEATGFEFKHDFTIIDSPRAVIFRDRYGVQMIMRFNEIHKFSDGTLQQIDEALDYRVKEFQINRTNLRE
ncbi:hypothetical protein Tco_0961921 [Tanacetum coccineum]